MKKVLVISDDYCEDLRRDNFYQEAINSCLDKKEFILKIVEKYPIGTNLEYYDIVCLDFGMVGNLIMSQVKTLSKQKNLIIIGALHPEYIMNDEWYKKHFKGRAIMSFKFDELGVELKQKFK